MSEPKKRRKKQSTNFNFIRADHRLGGNNMPSYIPEKKLDQAFKFNTDPNGKLARWKGRGKEMGSRWFVV
jgi:hypothetical protein